MATFVEITPDAFNEGFHSVGQETAVDRALEAQGFGDRAGERYNVRRPVRGIQMKDETYATLQVRTADGRNLPLFDAAGTIFDDGGTKVGEGLTTHNSNFLLQQVAEARAEKQQIVQTFGAPYIFFFGEQPRLISVSGVLLNTEDFNWRAEWWANYEQYLRGTACVNSKTRVYLSWDDIIVEGYIIQAAATEDASNRNLVQLQFQMFLTNYENISSIGDSFAHLAHREINLNPEQLDFLGSLGSGQSSTVGVREQNLRLSQQLSDGGGSNSLIVSIRNASVGGVLAAGTGRLVEVDGRLIDIISEAGKFVSGRNIRVPVGFEGSSVFDDAQVALASLSGAEAVITGTDRTVSISREFMGRKFLVEGSLGASSTPATYGSLTLNTDEFVARVAQALNAKAQPIDLFKDQTLDAALAGDRVRDVFEAFGVDVDPPDEARLLAIRGLFGIASVAVGDLLNKARAGNGTARFVANLL